METKIKELEESKIQLSVEISQDELKPEISNAYKRVAQKYTIPGFRKGKIPPHIIDLKIGKEIVIDEMLNNSLSKFYLKAIDEAKIYPVSRPKIEVIDVSDEKLEFNADVLVKPKIKLSEYKGVEVELPKVDASKKEIDEKLDTVRERFSKLETVDHEIKNGNFALVDYEVIKGTEKLEDMSLSDYMMEIDERRLSKEIYDVLAGAKAGEEKETKVTLPKEHSDPQLAGQAVDVKLKIKEVKERVLPEANDDFAKEASEFDTIKEFKADIKSNIVRQKEDTRKAMLPEKALSRVIDDADFNLAQEMVDEETDRLYNDFESSLSERKLKVEDYLQITGSTKEKIREEMEKEARRLISNEFILDTIAEQEDIKVEQEDIDNEIEKRAQAAGQSVDNYYKELVKNGRLYNIIGDIRLRKALDVIVDNAKVKDEVEVSEDKKSVDKKSKAKNAKEDKTETK